MAGMAYVCALQATHYRAGEIYYETIGPQTIRLTIVTYSKVSDQSAAADRDSLLLNWGDGTQELVLRSNGPDLDFNGIPDGVIIGDDVKLNQYTAIHTYPGVSTYVVSMLDQNRIDDIINIAGGAGGSVNIAFYVEDSIFYRDPNIFGSNSSPVLFNPPIDYANVQDTFLHNPNAYDADGDSLVFSLISPLQAPGLNVPAYVNPDQIIPGANNSFTINPRTGELLWATPQQVGIYNIAILVEEYRNFDGVAVKMGTVIRDMQIIVVNEPNDPPQLASIADTCITAGDTLVLNLSATDPNSSDVVTISANGAPIIDFPDRTAFSEVPGNPATATFAWATICNDISAGEYQLIFKAEDDYVSVSGTPIPLVDIESFLVQVVPPPPTGLQATVLGNDITLTWDAPYACETSDAFQYFTVYRRYGCGVGSFGCNADLASLGYEVVGTNITASSFTDIDVPSGHEYSYVVVAEFFNQQASPNAPSYNAVSSVPSDEACVILPLVDPIITNVDVVSTDATSGEVFVRWRRPLADSTAFDTLAEVGPYRFEVFGEAAFTPAPGAIRNTSSSALYAGLIDTFFTDNGLNTQSTPQSYRVDFYTRDSNQFSQSLPASSIYLSIGAQNEALNLTWQEEVPWNNTSYVVYRSLDNGVLFDSLTTIETASYLDTGLINDSNYCYYVESYGAYTLAELADDTLINKSQRICGIPIDTIPPCPPALSVSNDCDLVGNDLGVFRFDNRLEWTQDNGCGEDVESYNIYVSEDGGSSYDLIGNTSDLFYTDFSLLSFARCYVVTSVDGFGNESLTGDTVCVENCPIYELPNTFTPNGDGQNDLYTPRMPYRFIESVEFRIYHSWGNLVFETTDPDINWDGSVLNGAEASEGVYLYEGKAYVRTTSGLQAIDLPLGVGNGGFIHLIRSQ